MSTDTQTTFARILSELSNPTGYMPGSLDTRHDHSPFHLATLADCYSPDSIDSPGAQFLAHVAQAVADRLVDSDEAEGSRYALTEITDGDGAHEIADSAVPIYTHDRWATFVDLGAYNEDITDFGEVDDLTNAAGVALYMIAERLVRALAEKLTEALEDDDENESGWYVFADDGRVTVAGPFPDSETADAEADAVIDQYPVLHVAYVNA